MHEVNKGPQTPQTRCCSVTRVARECHNAMNAGVTSAALLFIWRLHYQKCRLLHQCQIQTSGHLVLRSAWCEFFQRDNEIPESKFMLSLMTRAIAHQINLSFYSSLASVATSHCTCAGCMCVPVTAPSSMAKGKSLSRCSQLIKVF